VGKREDQSGYRVLRIPAGLSVLRYISAADAAKPPTVRVGPRSSGTRLDLIPVPGEAQHILRVPGAAIALIAGAETELMVAVVQQLGSTSADVELHLELVARALPWNAQEESGGNGHLESAPSKPGLISVLGHVARLGDVVVASGEWLGGPEFPTRIEGVEIRWPGMPRGLDLEYSVTIGGKLRRQLPFCRVSEFAGSKGRSAPIVALTIVLRGEAAVWYSIKADCLFLGAQMMSRSGREIVLTGPTGREPLVGLRLAVEAASDLNLSRASTSPGLRVIHGPASVRGDSR
jgi:hypothetical protein